MEATQTFKPIVVVESMMHAEHRRREIQDQYPGAHVIGLCGSVYGRRTDRIVMLCRPRHADEQHWFDTSLMCRLVPGGKIEYGE